jgi:hypothetical protein
MSPLSKKGDKMFKQSLLIIAASIISSCDPLEGIISIKEKMTYKTGTSSSDCFRSEVHDPSCFEPNEKSIEPGEYTISMDQINKRTLRIEVKNKSVNHKMELKTQKKKVPRQGEFSLTAAESGQPFDLKSELNTEESRSSMMNETLICRETRYAGRSCYMGPGDYNEKPREYCETREDVFVGDNYQEFYYLTDTTNIIGKLLVGNKEVADLKGSKSDTNKIITYSSGCQNLRYEGTRIIRD